MSTRHSDAPVRRTATVDTDVHRARLVAVERAAYAAGPASRARLVLWARELTVDPGVQVDHVDEAVRRSPLLHRRADGRIGHLADLLDGIVLVHRVETTTSTRRRELRVRGGLDPLARLAGARPLELRSGGVARAGRGGATLLGPPGWLPDRGTGDLIGLRWRSRRLDVVAVGPGDLAGSAEHARTSALLVELACTVGCVGHGVAVTELLTLARLVDPQLLGRPHLPLHALLDGVGPDRRRHLRPVPDGVPR
ncbi:hypothetical protein [Nocardioides litoris]|uniref:hypothetical protein n=1 Tax=Nocardioides litoris TaxID=1926648 RepID=UPI00111D7883|nr:hypothetical protein [Nocardioides litoris]